MISRKGDVFVSHTMMIGFASIMVVIVAVSMITIHDNYSTALVSLAGDRVCNSLRLAVFDMADADSSFSNVWLTQKLADKNYIISADVYGFGIQWENKEKQCRIGIDATYKGRVDGGNVLIMYDKANDTITITGGN